MPGHHITNTKKLGKNIVTVGNRVVTRGFPASIFDVARPPVERVSRAASC